MEFALAWLRRKSIISTRTSYYERTDVFAAKTPLSMLRWLLSVAATGRGPGDGELPLTTCAWHSSTERREMTSSWCRPRKLEESAHFGDFARHCMGLGMQARSSRITWRGN
eukprot:1703467-Amphidinium_carterae.3